MMLFVILSVVVVYVVVATIGIDAYRLNLRRGVDERLGFVPLDGVNHERASAEFDFKKKVYLKQPGKTARFNKWVCVPLFPRLEEYLRSIQPQITDANIPIVMNFGYKSDAAFSRRFSRLLRDLEIKSDERGKASFHSLRGSAITWMKESGIPEEIRHDITGHTTKAVEDVYARAISNVSKVAREWK